MLSDKSHLTQKIQEVQFLKAKKKTKKLEISDFDLADPLSLTFPIFQ